MATQVEYYISCVLCTLLGVMFTLFATLNLLHNTGVFGSFGRKFGYEMDVVMGGLLGIPHYSKIEFLMLGFASAGALLSWSLQFGLITVLGLTSAASYMLICALYAYFAKLFKQEGPPFIVMGFVSSCLVCWRWTRFMEIDDVHSATIGVVCFAVITVIAGVIMMIRAPDRASLNERFALIMDYCDGNKDFVWLAGCDAPEGFSEPLVAEPQK